MLDPLYLAIKLVGKIKEVLWKVKENRKDCGKLAEAVDTLSADLSWLQLQGSPVEDPRVSSSMMRLMVTLESAEKKLVQITSANAVAQGFKADDIAEELDRARQDILMKAIWATFLTVRNSDSKLDQLVEGHAVLPAILRTGQEALQLLGQLSHIRDSTDDAGKENEMEAKQTVGASTAQSKGNSREESKASSASLPPARLKNYTWSDLEAAMASKEDIGGGVSNSIHKVELENESAVIKKFQWKKPVKARFVDELKLILKLKHKNIVRLMGYCYEYNESLVQDGSDDVRVDNKHHFCFVSRYMLKGSLVSIIEGGQNIDWPTLFGITQGIAKGIRYLHEQSVLHLDLKPKNILLDAHMIPKINNFGSATKFISDEVNITRNVNNRIGREYIAPELSSNKPKASTKSDVYSFGVILLEAISRMCATSEKGRPRGRNEWVDRLEGSDQLGNLFDSALVREELQTKAAIGCAFIGLMCCERDPADRPSMPEVVYMLDAYSHTRNTNNTNKVPTARRAQAKGKEKEQVVEAANRKTSSSSPSQVTIKDSSKSTPVRDKKPNYNILTRDKLLALMKQERFEMARDLNIAEGVAELLLCRYSWSPVTVRKKWSANREAVCRTVDWRSSDERPMQWFGTCMLCGMEFVDRISPGSCGHYYCQSCWRAYFSRQVRGPVVGWMCLNMRCPHPSCQAPVVRELVEKMADKADKDLYDKQVLHSWYPEKMAYAGRFWRWCPLDCGRAIESLGYYGPNDGEDVACDCGHNFCWR
ncbi:unnamed protein product [Urochloa decumbens]|uniref:Protein kinase domain-containing protein n=1 Tax=Urochloa decumbens TaxID=240449 RepID=A0ABC9B0N9_9POAL